MGWGSGAEVAEDVWNLVEGYISKRKKAEVALELTKLFQGHDCDTMGECDFVDEFLEYDEESGNYKVK